MANKKSLDWQTAKEWTAAFNAIGRAFYDQPLTREEIVSRWKERTGRVLSYTHFSLLVKRGILIKEGGGRYSAYKFRIDNYGEIAINPAEIIRWYDLVRSKLREARKPTQKEELPTTLEEEARKQGYILISIKTAKKLGIII